MKKIELPETEEPMVRVFLPVAAQDDSSLAVEQADNVCINGTNYRVKRGEYVEVPVPVYIQLRNKYPNI